MNLAWHFTRMRDGVPVLRDGVTPVPLTDWLVHEGPVAICSQGLHASWRALDALTFCDWPDAAVCLVEVEGIAAEEHADKIVCCRRRVIAWTPCDDLLRLFARECALSVVHLWEPPPIVREFLETGREEIRAAAKAAAWAAWDAAWDAAWAARAAAWAAWDAAGAARAAAWAAWDAARAAGAAAWDAWDAARDAGAAAEDAAGDLLESLLIGAMGAADLIADHGGTP